MKIGAKQQVWSAQTVPQLFVENQIFYWSVVGRIWRMCVQSSDHRVALFNLNPSLSTLCDLLLNIEQWQRPRWLHSCQIILSCVCFFDSRHVRMLLKWTLLWRTRRTLIALIGSVQRCSISAPRELDQTPVKTVLSVRNVLLSTEIRSPSLEPPSCWRTRVLCVHNGDTGKSPAHTFKFRKRWRPNTRHKVTSMDV